MNWPMEEATQSTEGKLLSANKAGEGLLAAGGVIGALFTSACCAAPLALFGLGISGAWIANLTALAPYQPIFLTLTVIFLAGGFVMVYRKSKTVYADGSYCASPASDKVVKVALWTATILVLVALVVSYAVPLMFDI